MRFCTAISRAENEAIPYFVISDFIFLELMFISATIVNLSAAKLIPKDVFTIVMGLATSPFLIEKNPLL